MPISKVTLALAVLSAAITSVAAQGPQQLDDLDAERISPDRVEIEFEYDGGACEEVGPAEVGEIVDGTLSVAFPTSSTAEMCTMQIVEIEVKQAIDAGETVMRVEVTLLAPDGEVMATGSDEVDLD